jgi:Tfp pilus assembly protein PilW
MNRQHGYSIVELVIAMGITLVVMTGVFSLVDPSRRTFLREGDAADMRQRTRVAANFLIKDLQMAGAGLYRGSYSGPLYHYVPGVFPYRRGALRTDAAGSFRDDTITIMYVPSTEAQSTLAVDLASDATAFSVNTATCPPALPACGFKPGDMALVFDASGSFDTFTVISVHASGGTFAVNRTTGGSVVYRAGSTMVKVVQRTFSLRSDAATHLWQLVVYDGATNGDVPMVDHVAGLRFEYLDEGGVPLAASDLTDGPWRPDVVHPNRFDADLLRVRSIVATIVVEGSNSGQTANEVSIRISPRNLNVP